MTAPPSTALLPSASVSASLEEEAAFEYANEILITKSELEEKNQVDLEIMLFFGNKKDNFHVLGKFMGITCDKGGFHKKVSNIFNENRNYEKLLCKTVLKTTR